MAIYHHHYDDDSHVWADRWDTAPAAGKLPVHTDYPTMIKGALRSLGEENSNSQFR